MIVVDASVALKWFVEEAGTPQAASLLDPAIIRFAPDLIVAEVCNAAWKSLRRGSMVRQQYATVADRLADLFTELVPSSAGSGPGDVLGRQGR